MALISISQLIGKTIYIKKPLRFFRVNDIIKYGDNAKPIENSLKTGYFFVLDSFLTPVEENKNYGFTTAKRSDYYFLWKGRDGGNYAVKYANDGRFSLDSLKEQGVITVKEQLEKEKEQNKTDFEKISDSVKNIFTGAGSTVKTLLFIGVGVWAVGYLLPKINK